MLTKRMVGRGLVFLVVMLVLAACLKREVLPPSPPPAPEPPPPPPAPAEPEHPQSDWAESGSMAEYILYSVRMLALTRGGRGYSERCGLSQDLVLVDGKEMRANRGNATCDKQDDRGRATPNKTHCVAAMAEVLVEALNAIALESEETNSRVRELDAAAWNGWDFRHFRSHIWQAAYQDAEKRPIPGLKRSRGSADAFARFGVGGYRDFKDLKAGDFVTFNRRGAPGHAVVFLRYLGPDGKETDKFTPDIKGFTYFSAQGRNKHRPGLGYMFGWFVDQCPPNRGLTDDCHILKAFTVAPSGAYKQNYLLLNTGYLAHPRDWQIKAPVPHYPNDPISEASPGRRGRGPASEGEIQFEGFEDGLPDNYLDVAGVPDPEFYRDGTLDTYHE